MLLKDSLISEDFAQIDGLILTNDETIALLLNYPVPSSIKNMHKQFLKLQITARNIFISLRSSAIDPIKALVAAKELENINNLWMPFINNLKNL